MEDPNHPELVFAKENSIKTSKRDELTNKIISDKGLKLITIAGTHGKTTTTAMAVWLFKQLGVPISYSVGAKVSFGDMGAYDPKSQYFILEADEFDRNFLSFHPYMSLITGIDWDHPDIYPSRDEYYQAFRQFIDQSEHAALWQSDVKRLDHKPTDHQMVLDDDDPRINQIKLTGQVNRQNAWLTANSLLPILNEPAEKLAKLLNDFPGLSRRFEEIVPGLYSDYAHTPGKIRGALQMAHEVAADKVVVVYEGLHNLRQHFIKDELKNLFDDVPRNPWPIIGNYDLQRLSCFVMGCSRRNCAMLRRFLRYYVGSVGVEIDEYLLDLIRVDLHVWKIIIEMGNKRYPFETVPEFDEIDRFHNQLVDVALALL